MCKSYKYCEMSHLAETASEPISPINQQPGPERWLFGILEIITNTKRVTNEAINSIKN